jgi:hypothetical protein
MSLKILPYTIQVVHELLLKEPVSYVSCLHHYEQLMEYVRPEGEKLCVWFCKDEMWLHFDG